MQNTKHNKTYDIELQNEDQIIGRYIGDIFNAM